MSLTIVAADGRDLLQKYEALGRANNVRTLRAQLLRKVQGGDVAAADVLRDPPWFMQDVRVFELLEAMPYVGRTTTRRLNAKGMQQWPGVNLLAPLGELTERQRQWLIEQIPVLGRNETGRAAAAQ
jgi:hypothetical protein